jgi:60 kDa SS-A/Ro ribonucleoprotein
MQCVASFKAVGVAWHAVGVTACHNQPDTNMANSTLFNTRAAALPAADARNEACGKAYAFSAKHALAQYAVTGCLNGTYYADAQQQLDTVLRLCGQVPVEFIAQTAVYCRERGHMKDMPALLCAALATLDTGVLKQVFDRVIDDGKMLRNFVQIVRSGVAGRKSLGTAPKRLVQRWFERRDDNTVFRASIGQSPSLGDVVKMVHPRPATPQRAALYAWLCGRQHDCAALPATVAAFERWKEQRAGDLPDVPFQMLTAQPLTDAQWAQIARKAPWQMMRMNLNTFLRHGVFKDRANVRMIANRLRDRDAIRKARAFPYQLMAAFMNADASLPRDITDALQDAMEIAVENVPAIAGKVWILPDVSGSMHSPATGHRAGATTKVRCIDVAALVAAAFVRANADARVLPFSDDVVPAKLNARDSIMTNAQKLASLPSGGTNCSAPLAWLNRQQAKGDLVLYVSDNESWMDANLGGRATQTMAEWDNFRRRNPGAKLVCLDIQPYAHTQAKEQSGILNVGGFSDAVFEIIAQFAAGKMVAGHWVRSIEAYT